MELNIYPRLNENKSIEIQINNLFQSPEIVVPEIFQMNQQIINNNIYLNFRTQNYVLNLPYKPNYLADNSNDFNKIFLSSDNLKQSFKVIKGFDSNLIDMKVSNYFSEENYIITSKNSVYLLENDSLTLIGSNEKNSTPNKNFYFIENSFHPKCKYLMSFENLCLFDTRSSQPSKLIENVEKYQRFFGVKHYYDQNLIISSSKNFVFYDIRSNKTPLMEIKHYSDESPPSILEFSSSFGDLQNNFSSLESCIENMDLIDHNIGFFSEKNKIMLGFSTDKTGSCVATCLNQDLLTKEINNDLIKISETTNNLPFSFKKFLNTLNPLLLYSHNMKNERYRIAGVNCFSLNDKTHLIFESDSFGGLSMQILENNRFQSGLKHLKLNYDGESKTGNTFLNFSSLKSQRFFEKNNKKTLVFLNYNENNNDIENDFDLEQEIEPLSEKIKKRNLKFRNLEKFFKGLLKKTKNKKKNEKIIMENNEIFTKINQEQIYKPEKEEINLEDLIFNQTTEELLNQKQKKNNCFNDNFVMTNELEDYLKEKWNEDKQNKKI